MSWREELLLSTKACQLALKLPHKLNEVSGGMKSTANTDVENKVITIDVSQRSEKCALSYAYELKNLENSDRYQQLNILAQAKKISKHIYVSSYLLLEAEAAFFRCKVFRDMDIPDSDCPFKKDYLTLYDRVIKKCTDAEAVDQFALYIQEHGVVRRQFSAKKYYADCYDYYSGGKPWPKEYDEPPTSSVIHLPYNSSDNENDDQSDNTMLFK